MRHSSPILKVAARGLLPFIMLLFSILVLIRGHDEPGGGFVGGLLAAAGLALHGMASGVTEARRLLYFRPLRLIGTGLLVSIASGLVGPLTGTPFLTGVWVGGFGTPLLFDVGVYLLIVGVATSILFSLEEV